MYLMYVLPEVAEVVAAAVQAVVLADHHVWPWLSQYNG